MIEQIGIVNPYLRSIMSSKELTRKRVAFQKETATILAESKDINEFKEILKIYEPLPKKYIELHDEEIFKYDNQFYFYNGYNTISLKYNSQEINLRYAEQIDIGYYVLHAIKNIQSIITEEIELGDKVRIRDIAYKSLIANLELSAHIVSCGEIGRGLYKCIHIEYSSYAHMLLRDFDFKFKIPSRKFNFVVGYEI